MHHRYFTFLALHLIPLVLAAHIRPFISLSPILSDAATLPPSTHATLTTISHSYSAPLRYNGHFDFRNVTTGSYLMDIHCHTHFFAPLRVDVLGGEGPVVQVWGTFRGNEWDNKGQAFDIIRNTEGREEILSFAVSPLVRKEYFNERLGFSPLNLLKNPMILIAALTMVIVFGMPYLMENIDPEFKTEFEERQKSSVANPATVNPLQNFDAAAWLAGSKSSAAKKSDTDQTAR